ncbi:50S ribosomal protein LX [Sulfolobales archaeon HS-7]|nr:50S ribosomal protein LX [Sulfolobales archaeon HS-7]
MKVKIFVVKGEAVFNVSRYPTVQKFTKFVTALNEVQAKEKVYSELGSKNKIKRYNIRITEIREVEPEQVKDRSILALLKLDKIILER